MLTNGKRLGRRWNKMRIKNFYNQNTELILNFLPINFLSRSFVGYTIPYTDEKKLRNLRKNHQDFLFHRNGDEIYCVPLKEDLSFDGERKTFSVDDDRRLVAHLVRECLRKVFTKNKETIIFNVSPLELVDYSYNLLSKLTKNNGLGIYPKFSIDVRSLYPKNSEPVYGLIFDIDTFYEIGLTIEDLLNKNIDIHNIYVVSREKRDFGNFNLQKAILQGRIESITGGIAKLSDFREKEQIEINQIYPEASKRNFKKILLYLIGEDKYKEVIERLEKDTFNLLGAEGKLKELEKIKSEMKKYEPFECASDLKFTVADSFLLENDSVLSFRKYRIPTFIFDPAKNKTHHWHDDGLNEYGPFDSESFAKKNPKLAIVVPKEYKGEVETFISAFKNGILKSKRFEKGFVRKYHLNDFEKLDFIPIENKDIENAAKIYKNACLSTLENNSFDLAVIIIDEQFHQLKGNKNPYLVSKSTFMSQGIPVQEIEIETIRDRYSWQYTLNNFSLACYAKLGGIPWTISSLQPVSHELVIGLGSATVFREGRLSGTKRYVGITTVFSADGNYLLSNISKEVTFEEYERELLKSLKLCIEEVSKRNAWQSGDNVRLVFHQTFKKFKDIEVETIKKFVNELADYNVEFAFVHISDQGPLILLDKNQEGKPITYDKNPKYRGLIKGRFVPDRGYNSKLNPYEAILTLTGPNQLLTPFQPVPKPITISLHRGSTFRDIDYLCRQIYEFTFLSWRSFNPTTKPVTILYSNLIAGLLGLLRDVENWNPDILRTKLKFSRWFL